MQAPLHFTLAVPQYNEKSNGIKILYYLGDLLEQLGHGVSLYCDAPGFQRWKTDCPKRYIEKIIHSSDQVPKESYLIYTDTTTQATIDEFPERNRIWYFLNYPGYLLGNMPTYRPKDMIVSYSGIISKAYPNLFITLPIKQLEAPINIDDINSGKENLILLYFGKSRTTIIPEAVKHLIRTKKAKVVTINRIYPASREELIQLLRRARLLVSFDPLTNLNYEATLCGTPCYIADNYMALNFADYNIPLPGIFESSDELKPYYCNGLDRSTLQGLWDTYTRTNNSAPQAAEAFVQHCRDWFSCMNMLEKTDVGINFIEQHNRLRMQNDQLRMNAMRSQAPTQDLSAFLPKYSKQWFAQKRAKVRFKILRTWYKHIKGLRGDALRLKLDEIIQMTNNRNRR